MTESKEVTSFEDQGQPAPKPIIQATPSVEAYNEERRENIARDAARNAAMTIAGEAFMKLDVDGSGELEREEITQLAGMMGDITGDEEERERKID